MTGNPRNRKIKLAFETTSLRIPLAEIEMLRVMTTSIKKSIKFGQIAASIREVGIIEPPVVVRIKGQRDRYRLLDGHIRSEEHTSELQSLMRISYAVFCLKKKKITKNLHY